jgi:hypothetical protein
MPIIFDNVGTAVPPDSSHSATDSSIDPAYQMSLHVTGDDTLDAAGRRIYPIIANLPERFNLGLSSNWSQPFERHNMVDNALQGAGATGGLVGAAGGKYAAAGRLVQAAASSPKVKEALNFGLQTAGIGSKLRSQSASVWDGSSGLEFTIDMHFHSHSNTMADVQDKQRAMMKLIAPTLFGEILSTPGPTLIGNLLGGRNIILTLGKFIRIENVIITNVSSDISCLMDENDLPIAMVVSVGIRSFYSCFTADDVDNMFLQKG